MEDVERHRVGREGLLAFERLRLDLDLLVAVEAVARQAQGLVDTDRAERDPALHAGPGDAVQLRRQELVEALPACAAGDQAAGSPAGPLRLPMGWHAQGARWG